MKHVKSTQRAHNSNKECFPLRAAIYHYTDVSSKRPGVYKKTIQSILDFASDCGYSNTEIFCDFSLKKYEQTEFIRFLSCANQFDALFVMDYTHICKNTKECMRIIRELAENGLRVYTLRDGIFQWDIPPFTSSLRVATYCCHLAPACKIKESIPIENDILKLFVCKETNWNLIYQFSDENPNQTLGVQPQFEELFRHKDDYDLLLVHNMNDIYWRTAEFCKRRSLFQKDIFSLQDGFLPYNKGDDKR